MNIRSLLTTCLVFTVIAVALPQAGAAESREGLTGPCGSVSTDETNLNEGPTDFDWRLRPVGTLEVTIMYVDFVDAAAGSQSTSTYLARLIPGMERWYQQSSYGKLTLDIRSIDRWYRMPQESTEYGFTRGLTFFTHQAYIEDAVRAADGDVDFGSVDLLIVVPTREAAIEFSPAFVPMAGFGVTADGNELRHAVTMGQAEMWNEDYPQLSVNTLVHEMGHVIGLPDLYDFDAPSFETLHEPVGGWDIMGFTNPATDFLAWHKWKLGWLDENDIACLGFPGSLEATLAPIETSSGTKALVIRTGPATAYVAEVRRRLGVDADICDEGVLVYSVDANVETGHRPVVVGSNEKDDDPLSRDVCGPKYNAPLQAGGSFSDATAGVSFKVLSESGDAFAVRATFSGFYTAPVETYARASTLKLSRHLVARGRVTSPFLLCASEIRVRIQRKRGSSWSSVASTLTDASGAFNVKLRDRTGRYRAVAPRARVDPVHACALGKSPTRAHVH